MDNWPDKKLRSYLLSKAAVSTTALSLIDTRLPAPLLALTLSCYLRYFQALTGARAIELYSTTAQEQTLDNLGGRPRLVSYHVPWQKQVSNLARLVNTPHTQPITATIHYYEWANHFHRLQTGQWLADTPDVLEGRITQTQPTTAELNLLDQAAENKLTILFETVVDREFYNTLTALNQSRETFLFQRLDFARRLRDAWLARHPGETEAPVGIVFNPWHAAFEMQGPEIRQALKRGRSSTEIRAGLLPLLEQLYAAADGMVQRFYVGNSRRWELRLPAILQRGHFLDPDGIIPEMALMRRALRDRPQLASAITLEASPQSALFSGRLAVRKSFGHQLHQVAS